MRSAEHTTEAEGAPPAEPAEGSREVGISGRGASEVEGEEESDASGPVATAQRSPRRQVVRSRPNTAEVMIVRPAGKGKGAEVTGPTNEVSAV